MQLGTTCSRHRGIFVRRFVQIDLALTGRARFCFVLSPQAAGSFFSSVAQAVELSRLYVATFCDR